MTDSTPMAIQVIGVAASFNTSLFRALGEITGTEGRASHGWWSRLDAPYYISLVIIHKTYNEGRLNDSASYG